MDTQKLAKAFGWLFILTFVTSIIARVLFHPLWGDDGTTIGTVSDTSIYLGAVFEFLLVVTNIGTAVVLYPVMKRHSEAGAIGYITARVMECVLILIGLISLISIFPLGGGLVDAASGRSLVSTYEFAFLFGPGLVAGVGNGLLLGYLMYTSGLVPRRMAQVGMFAGCSMIVAFLLVLFGVLEVQSAGQGLLSIPEMVWEGFLGIYCAWKGFQTKAVIDLDSPAPAGQPNMATI